MLGAGSVENPPPRRNPNLTFPPALMAPPDNADWVAAMPLAELPPGAVAEALVGGEVVALVNVAGEVHALDGLGQHQGGPLGRGRLEGCVLTCPWHGWRYDITSGRQVLSERVRLRRYPVRVEGGTIWISPRDG